MSAVFQIALADDQGGAGAGGGALAAPPASAGLYDSKGRFYPFAIIKPLDRQRHELVLELVARAQRMSAELEGFKREVMGEIGAFLDLSAQEYGAKVGGAKGNVTLHSFDGRYKIERAMADKLVFDERLQSAKSLIDDCIREWTKDANDETRALVEHAFQVDKEGKVSTERVLGLRKLNITGDRRERWELAMTAIADSVQVSSSRAYVRFYERIEDSERYRPINLNISSAGER